MAADQMQKRRRVIPALLMLHKQNYELVSSIVIDSVTNCDVMLGLTKLRRDHVPRIQHYCQQIVPMYSLDDFKSHFRLSRHSFQTLLAEMEKAPTLNQATGPSINIEKELLMFLWYLGNLECFRSMADRFGVSKGSFHASVKRTSSALVQDIMAHVIQWPRDNVKLRETSAGYSQLSEFQGVIGAIDGTHIQIKAPSKHAPAYYNRKQFHSVVLLACCNANNCFTYAWTGNPGSTHDATVLRTSDLFQQAEDLIPHGFYLLGDSAFPLTRWLITPFRNFGNLTQQQNRFNTAHAKARVAIERTFGLLKCRFRRLLRLDASDMNIIVNSILSACILHNICVKDGDGMFEDIVDENCFDNNERGAIQRNELSGIRVRQELMQQMQAN